MRFGQDRRQEATGDGEPGQGLRIRAQREEGW